MVEIAVRVMAVVIVGVVVMITITGAVLVEVVARPLQERASFADSYPRAVGTVQDPAH